MWDILVAVVTICIGIYMWATWNYGYWKKCSVPYIKPLPLFGNTIDLFFMKKNSGHLYSEFYWKFPNEAAVGIYKMRTPQLVLRDLDLIKTAMIKEFNSFHDNIYSTGFKNDPILEANPFTASGEHWKTLRSLHTQSQTSNKIKGMFPLMMDICKDMNEYLKQNLGKEIETKYFSGQYTTDSVASCVYGLKTSSFQDPDAEFRQMSAKFFKQDSSTTFAIMLLTLMPSIATLFKIRLLPKDVTDFFIKIVQDVCEYRQQNKVTRNDFLQALLDEQESGKPKYTVEEITAHTMTFFIDGYETSSTVMAFTIYMLALHQEIQERLRDEIKEISKIDYETVHDLKYLDAVVNETLRMYPPGLVLTRLCTNDVVLKSGDKSYPISKNVSIAVPLYAIFRDPKYYTEPTVFDPSRFCNGPTPPCFFPFGLGSRACLGSRFALTLIKLALVNLVKNFKIIPRDADAKLPTLDPQQSIVIVPKSGLWIKFEDIK